MARNPTAPTHPAHTGHEGASSQPHAIVKAKGGYNVRDLNPATKKAHPHGFGVSKTHAEAVAHLRAIEYFKHNG